jgi:hypothetical protein
MFILLLISIIVIIIGAVIERKEKENSIPNQLTVINIVVSKKRKAYNDRISTARNILDNSRSYPRSFIDMAKEMSVEEYESDPEYFF